MVPKEWIDKNGHMNVVSYMALFDIATDALLEKCGIGLPGEDLTMVAARIMIDYRKELTEGETWELRSGIISAQPSYITITHRLHSAGTQRSICDIRLTPFSKLTRGIAFLDEGMLKKTRELIISGLVDRFILPIISQK